MDLTRDLPPTDVYWIPSQHEALILAIVSMGPGSKLPHRTEFVILDKTPFYATRGQEAHGDLRCCLRPETHLHVASVLEVQKAPSGVIVHKVKVGGQGIKVGQKVTAWVDPERRRGL